MTMQIDLEWTARDEATLDRLMSAPYPLTKPERRRLKELLSKRPAAHEENEL